jgi:hypothetical protein
MHLFNLGVDGQLRHRPNGYEEPPTRLQLRQRPDVSIKRTAT